MTRRSVVFVALAWTTTVLVGGARIAAQSDPFHGSWKLNVSKSTFAPGSAPRDEIVTYTITGDEEKFNADGRLANGARDQFFYTARFDGKEYPSKTVITDDRQAAVLKIDPRSRDRFSKVDGRVVMRARRVVSDDGLTLTSTVYAVSADSRETLRERRVFDRQGPTTGDPFHGTWKLNVSRSRFNDRTTASKSETLTISVKGDTEVTHVEAVTPTDAIEVQDYTVKHDGNYYPNKVVTTNNNMVSLRKVDARTRERLSKNAAGRITGISRRVVSADGRTLTTSLINVDESGKETVRQVRVFDKQ